MKKLSYRKMKNLFNPVTGGVEPIKKKKKGTTRRPVWLEECVREESWGS